MKQKIGTKKIEQGGQKLTLTPFEDLVHLQTMVRLNLRGRTIGAYLLKKGKQDPFSLVFGFDCQGIHSFLSKEDTEIIFEKIETGLLDLPPAESITFHLGAFKTDSSRQQHLEQLLQTAPCEEVKFFLYGEKARIQELAAAGLREPKTMRIYVTYTPNNQSSTGGDWIESILGKIENFWDSFTNKANRKQRNQLSQLLKKAFLEGFNYWEQVLATKLDLKITALTDAQLWQILWERLNQSPVIPEPQVLILDPSGLREEINSKVHSTTLLTADSVPILDRQWVYANNRYTGALTFWDKPGGWKNKQTQLRYLWELIARDTVTDTEIFCQITPANPTIVRTSMQKVTKQSNVSARRANSKDNVDVASLINTRRSIAAMEKLYEGKLPYHTGVVILVHRSSQAKLDEACRNIENYFHRPAWVVRETAMTGKIWLQTLPIVKEKMLTLMLGINRRFCYLNEELPGLIPLVNTQSLDREGIELIAEDGGTPIFIDLFNTDEHKNLAIFATTRGGKSVLVSSILTQAGARNIPVVALDYPKPDGTSTFTDYTEFMGARGAYLDVGKHSINLFDRPSLQALNPEKQQERFEDYKDFLASCLMAMVIGASPDQSLSQTIRTLLYCALEQFFTDGEIQTRYTKAEAVGLNSPDWQLMPTLRDFIPFCSLDRLEQALKLTKGINWKQVSVALEQIQLRLNYWCISRVGKAISHPSSVPTEAPLLVFALRQVQQGEDAAILALVAYAASLRRALAYPVSIFFIDESPILFKFRAIANLVGDLCANGGKSGIRVILTGQDPNTIANSAAGSRIFQNLSTRLIGRIESNAVPSFEQILLYPRSLISRNVHFRPNKQQIYTRWLLDRGGVFTECRYYPALIQLGITANNPDEQWVREQFLVHYHDKFEAIAHFSQHLIYCMRTGTNLRLLPWNNNQVRHENLPVAS
ncbi:MAG: hypothetical protein AB4368_00270 [Xenococcaceae cyanobacterium]